MTEPQPAVLTPEELAEIEKRWLMSLYSKSDIPALLAHIKATAAPKHIYPLSDLREHVLTGLTCWCAPYENGGVIVHNSMDRREEYERGRKPS